MVLSAIDHAPDYRCVRLLVKKWSEGDRDNATGLEAIGVDARETG